MTAPIDKPVAQAPEPWWDGVCWTLVNADGSEPDDNGYTIPHFYSEFAAREYATVEDEDDGPLATCIPRRLAAACVTVECAECGYTHDEDDEGVTHWESREEAVKALAGDWLFVDGKAYCTSEDCAEAARAVVIEEIPDQIAIDDHLTPTPEGDNRS